MQRTMAISPCGSIYLRSNWVLTHSHLSVATGGFFVSNLALLHVDATHVKLSRGRPLDAVSLWWRALVIVVAMEIRYDRPWRHMWTAWRPGHSEVQGAPIRSNRRPSRGLLIRNAWSLRWNVRHTFFCIWTLKKNIGMVWSPGPIAYG